MLNLFRQSLWHLHSSQQVCRQCRSRHAASFCTLPQWTVVELYKKLLRGAQVKRKSTCWLMQFHQVCVELAGLPTPLSSHPLPSSPSTFPHLPSYELYCWIFRNYPAPLNNFPKPLSNPPNKDKRSEGRKGHHNLIR